MPDKPNDSRKNKSDTRRTNLYISHRKKRSDNPAFGQSFGFLNKVPWEKISIWTIFLFLLWTLRDFFTLILLTFVFTYIANTIVRFLSDHLEVDRRPLTFILYLGFLGVFIGPGHWFANRVIEQGQEVVKQADTFIPQLGTDDRRNLQKEMDESTGKDGSTESPSDESSSKDDTGSASTEEGEKETSTDTDSTEQTPSSSQTPEEFPTEKRRVPDARQRDSSKAQNLTWKLRSLELQLSLLDKRVKKLQNRLSEEGPSTGSSSKSKSIQRAENVPEDVRKFVDGILSENLSPEWMNWVQDRGLYDYLLVKVNQIWEEGMPYLIYLTNVILMNTGNFLFTLLLAFLFSFFIVFDIPRLQKRLSEFEEGRLRDFYHEIAPSLANFGIVMGRSLQAQAMIAVVNTILTVSGIYLMSVVSSVDFTPYLAVLTIIVFVCSFIPVLGVIISTVPIGLIALVDGGIGYLIAIIVLILGIHGLETYVLNPNIYGVHMRMHPLIVLIVLLVAEHFFGLWGLVLGVPVSVYLLDIVIQQTTPEELFYETGKE